ncbi:MAG: hypothetical protein KME46_32450 [Brasilonema angustatum HA4187-MV1]|jgi:hypothetical protein|nr:hypothetical protein [Brasilonema angustatum HA4187-MV1]
MILSYNQVETIVWAVNMHKYLIEVSNIETEDTALLQITADTPEEAVADIENGWEVIRVRKPWGGKREGAGRVSKWGENVETHRYRLPKPLGDNAEEVVESLESLKTVLEVWENKVTDSKARSGGKVGERYKYVEQMLEELKKCLSDLPESFI